MNNFISNGNIHNGFLEVEKLVDLNWILKTLNDDLLFQELFFVARNDKNLENIVAQAVAISAKYKNIIIVGIGGSTLASLAYYNLNPQRNPKNKIYFLDNLDVSSIDGILNSVNLKESFFIFISKSGETIETLVQMCAILDTLTNVIANDSIISEICLTITGNNNSKIGKISEKYGISVVPWSGNVSGRFSAFSNNINLINAIIGVNVRENCKNFIKLCEELPGNEDFVNHINFTLSSLNADISSTVLFGYSDKLSYFIDWYIQLWAESIGKNGIGTNPCKSIGTIDQHSKLQMYLDGKKDKIFTIIGENKRGKCDINWGKFENCGIEYLNNKSINDVINASYNGTIISLCESNLPVRTFTTNAIDERFLTSMMSFYILETILCCHYLKINPYNQPKVEDSKKNLYSCLNL